MPYRIRRLFRGEAILVGFCVTFFGLLASVLLLALFGMLIYMLTGHDLLHMGLKS